MTEDSRNKGLYQLGETYKGRAEELETHIEKLKELLFAIRD
jgi:hypothetical protein